MSRLRRSIWAAEDGVYRTPRRARGMSPMMIRALKMTADKIADCGEDSRMMFRVPRPTKTLANMAGMIAGWWPGPSPVACALPSSQTFGEGSEGQDREELQPDNDEGDDDDEGDKQCAVGAQGPVCNDWALGGEAARQREHQDHRQVASEQHGQGQGGVVEAGVAGKAREGASVAVGGADEGVKDLGQAMGPRVAYRGPTRK